MKAALSLLLILALVSFATCGKKGPPVLTLKSKEVEVKNLKAEPKDGQGIWLTWRVDKVSEDLSGFLLSRGDQKNGADTCRDCPDFYTTIADLKSGDSTYGNNKDEFAFLDDNVQKGHHYYYRVQPKYSNGALGRNVEVDLEIY
jgi:predicted small lipoprotein YifL